MAVTESQMPHWLKFPQISAPDPENRNKLVSYRISENWVECNAAALRRTPIFQAWAHVVGQLPPINNIDKLEETTFTPTLTTLVDSIACFRGVKRPYDEQANGESIVVYVLNPEITIQYRPDMACVAEAVEVPRKSTLTVQVKPRNSLLSEDSIVAGEITRVEFLFAEGLVSRLPSDYRDRYIDRLW
jgi:hypothetical protein